MFDIDIKDVISLTPYKELHDGKESIRDHVKEGYTVPDKVIEYLKTTTPFVMSPGIYEHPFKPGVRLLGPYWFTDGKYYWDRDTWKYVVKYGLVLPDDFIDHVMSEEGTAFLRKCKAEDESWSNVIKEWKEQPDSLCLIPDNIGDKKLKDF